jgi:CBS domain-containing protein
MVAVKDVVTAHPDQTLGEISEVMSRMDIDRIPVVDTGQSDRIVGIIARTDIIRLEEVSDMLEQQ